MKVVFGKSDDWTSVKQKIAYVFSVKSTSNSSIIVSDAELDTTNIPTLGSYLSMLHGVGCTVFGLYVPELSASGDESSHSVKCTI